MYRILSQDELDFLTPGAVSYIYAAMMDPQCPPDAVEKTLIHAGIISRMEHCRIDDEGIEFLFERVCADGGLILLEAGDADADAPLLSRWEV